MEFTDMILGLSLQTRCVQPDLRGDDVMDFPDHTLILVDNTNTNLLDQAKTEI